MIIKKVINEMDKNGLKTLIEVDACDCEIDALHQAVEKDINICPMCGEGCDEPAPLREPAFGGAFYDEYDNLIYIEKVIYNKPAVIVIWSDGTKTISKVQKGDTYNKELGLTLCVLKKLVGSSQVVSLLNEWVDEKSNYIDLKFIRS